MRLTKTTSHAVRILLDCAVAGGERLKVADIAKRLNITQLNVFKIVHLLSRAGFVEAARGRYGGVRLTRAADQIRVGEVVRAMESTEMEVAGLPIDKRKSRRDTKPQLSSIFDNALEAFIGVLDQHSLADLIGTTRHRPIASAAAKKNRTRKTASVKLARRATNQTVL
jgi:Rrf2 family nitric oxide-sensitive transcriptional repressor